MPDKTSAIVGTRDESNAAPGAAPVGRETERNGAWAVRTFRPHPGVTVFDVQLSNYHEYFLVAAGQKTISITMLDPGDVSHPEPQTFVFAKPYGWDETLDDDEALLQVWQSVGIMR